MGRFHSVADAAGEAGLLSPVCRELQVDGPNEEFGAPNEDAERAVRGRQTKIPTGNDGDLQERKSQPAWGVLANRYPDTSFHRALLGATGKRRTKTSPVYFMVAGPFDSRPLLRITNPNGCFNVRPTIFEPDPA